MRTAAEAGAAIIAAHPYDGEPASARRASRSASRATRSCASSPTGSSSSTAPSSSAGSRRAACPLCAGDFHRPEHLAGWKTLLPSLHTKPRWSTTSGHLSRIPCAARRRARARRRLSRAVAFRSVSTPRPGRFPWSWYTDPAVLRLEQERIFRRFWQYVGPGRGRGAGLVRRVAGRRRSRRARPRPRRRAPRLPERLPPPRLDRLRGIRQARDAPVPLPRLDVRPRRPAHHSAEVGTRGRVRRRTSSGSSSSRSIPGGRSSSSTPTPTPPRSRTTSRTSPSASQRGDRPRRASLPPARGVRARRNWKISRGELPRVLPLPDRASRLLRRHGRLPRRVPARDGRRRMTQHGPPRPEPRGTYDPTGEVERGQFHLLFPGTVINVMPGRPNFSIGPIVPLAPERTYRFLDYFVARGRRRGVDRGDRSPSTRRWARRTGCSSSASRRASGPGSIEEGRLMPESEQLVAHFQALVRRRARLTRSPPVAEASLRSTPTARARVR